MGHPVKSLDGKTARVGGLAVSRTIGDYSVKDNYLGRGVIATPEIFVGQQRPDDEFFVIGTDGLWDVLSNEEVVGFVRSRLLQNTPLRRVCYELVEYAIKKMHSRDDVSALIILLKPHQKFSTTMEAAPAPADRQNLELLANPASL
jgi:serine/threonine protein phosphatase PrpC